MVKAKIRKWELILDNMAILFDQSNNLYVSGYSERGIFNALLHEICNSTHAKELLRKLLLLVKTSTGTSFEKSIHGGELFIEPSLSDFGDVDAIALIHGEGWRRSIFFEGKVKSAQRRSWTVNQEWKKFISGLSERLESSNLFAQLYYKIRFANTLKDGGIKALQLGIDFPACSKKRIRKIGANPVVLRMTSIIEKYLDESFFIMIVPDNPRRVSEFFENDLTSFDSTRLQGWDISHWGYLCWQDVRDFCYHNDLINSLRVFELNRGQIY